MSGRIIAFIVDRVFLLHRLLSNAEELDRFRVHVYPIDELSVLPEHAHQHDDHFPAGRDCAA